MFMNRRTLLLVLAICFGSVLSLKAFNSVNKDSEFSFSTFYNPTTNDFISDLTEMLRILKNHGFRQTGIERGNWENLCQMSGCECVRIYTYRKEDIIVKLYIDDIIDPHGEWVSTDIIFKSEAEQAKFLKQATEMGFREGLPFEGSVFYTREIYEGCIFESGSRYGREGNKFWPAISFGCGYDDAERDEQIFMLTPEVRAKLKQYDEIDLFSYGLARVSKAGKYGFINLNGDEVIPCIYDRKVGRFSEGLALVELDYYPDYDAAKVMFIDKEGRVIIYGNYYLPRPGNSLDAMLEGPPVFYKEVCDVLVDANCEFPDGNYKDKEMLFVTINKKGKIISIENDNDSFNDDDDYDDLTGEFEITCYPYGYMTPIEKACKNEALTGSPYYIGRDIIPGGNGSSIVSLYLVDLTNPNSSQLVEEIHGIMDYRGVSTISPTNKTNFEQKAMRYISLRNRDKKKIPILR